MLAEFGALLRAIGSGRDPGIIPQPSEVIPTFDVFRPEFAYLQACYRYAGQLTQAADPANPSVVALVNPANSEALVVVTEIQSRSTTAIVNVNTLTEANTAAYDSDGTEYAVDGRVEYELGGMIRGRQPSCVIKRDITAISGQNITRIYPSTRDGTSYFVQHKCDYVVLPGFGLALETVAADEDLYASFWWRERRLDAEEVRGVDPRIL